MKEQIEKLQLELIRLTNEYLNHGNSYESAELSVKIITIRETLKVLQTPIKWSYVTEEGVIDPTDVITLREKEEQEIAVGRYIDLNGIDLQRYDIEESYDWGGMCENEYGEWVKYEDVIEYLKR